MCHILPGSMSKHARIFSLMASSGPPFIMSDVTLLEGEEKNRYVTLTQFTNAWQLSQFYWSNKPRSCRLVDQSLNINQTPRGGLFSLFCEAILMSPQTHKNRPQTCMSTPDKLSHRQTQTIIDSCNPPLSTHKHPTAKHTRTVCLERQFSPPGSTQGWHH